MTREEVQKRLFTELVVEHSLEQSSFNIIENIIDEIFNNVEKEKSCDGCKYVNNRTRYHDCEFDTCIRYSNLRNYPDMYKEKEL
jgi:hypothetical protein